MNERIRMLFPNNLANLQMIKKKNVFLNFGSSEKYLSR